MNVLVVENEWVAGMLVTEMLGELGHECTVVPTAEAALRAIRENGNVDLILLDVGLPDMDGRQLAERIHQLQPELRMVFVSGYPEDRIRQAAADFNAAYLPKPFLLDDLKKMVGRCD